MPGHELQQTLPLAPSLGDSVDISQAIGQSNQADLDELRARELLAQFTADVSAEDLSLLTEDETRANELLSGFQQQIQTTAQGMRAEREMPFREGLKLFGQDYATMFKNVFKDTTENFVHMAQNFERNTIRGSMETLEQLRQRKLDQADTASMIDVIRDAYFSATLSAVTFGMDHLPWVGNILSTKIDPLQAALNQRAEDSIEANMLAYKTTAGKLVGVTLPNLSGLASGMYTGATAVFKPFMAFGRFLFGAKQVLAAGGAARDITFGASSMSLGRQSFLAAVKETSPGIIGDIAGFGIFGVATGERGILAAMAPGGDHGKEMGERLFELDIPDDATWTTKAFANTYNRLLAGAVAGSEGLLLLSTFQTFGALANMASHRFAGIKSNTDNLLNGTAATAADYRAWVQAQFSTDPGLRRYARINNVTEAEAVVELAAYDDIIQNSADAMRLLAENQGIEGIVSYQTSVAALAKGVHELAIGHGGNTAVLRNIDDPYRMYRDVLQRSETGTVVGLQQDQQLLVHAANEVPEGALFGYISGEVKAGTGLSSALKLNTESRNPMPIHILNRPNPTAVELRAVEEVVIIPTKVREFDNWNVFIESVGDDILEATTKMRKNGTDAVVIKNGAGFEQEIMILDPRIIRSSKPVLPEHLQPTEMSAGELMARELANEPIEIALSKRMPDYIFEAPILRENGKYDIVFRRRGAPGLSNAQRRQFKDTGWFSGQQVTYGGTQWEVMHRTRKGQGDRLRLRNLTTGTETTATIKRVQGLPGAQIDVPIDNAVYKEFVTYLDEKMGQIHKNQISSSAIRDIARNSELEPGQLQRDYHVGRADVLVNGEMLIPSSEVVEALQPRVMQLQQELMQLVEQFKIPGGRTPEMMQQLRDGMQEFTQLQKAIQGELARIPSAAARGIDLETAFIQFPDPLDHFSLIWKRFLQDKGISGQVGELESMKMSVIRRLNTDMFQQLPRDVRVRFLNIQNELLKSMDNMPDTLENAVRLAGFHLLRPKGGGFVLQRPGSIAYEGIYQTEDAVYAAVNNAYRNGSTPSTTPQTNWLTLGLPVGGGPGRTAARDLPSDLHFTNAQDAVEYISGRKELREGKYFQGKPAWAVKAEELTGFPLWEHMDPMFNGMTVAGNQAAPFEQRVMDAGMKMNNARREALGDFITSVESQTVYLNRSELIRRAKAEGLDADQINFLNVMRDVHDDLFGLGMDWFNFKPNDFIYQYFTNIRATNMAQPQGARTYVNLPKDMDIFVSKYERTGSMLPDRELDPMTVSLKYIKTFFHEKHVAPHWERLRAIRDTKMSELPDDIQRAVRQRAPSGRNTGPDDLALPAPLHRALDEMLLSIHGNPRQSDQLLVRMMQTVSKGIGITLPNKVAENMIGAMQSWHYGATLAGRGRPVIRNGIQTFANLYPRLDARSIAIGVERANTHQGEALAKAMSEGIVDNSSLGVLFAEDISRQILEEMPIEIIRGAVRTPLAWMGRGFMRQFLLDGKLARGARLLTEVGMSGIRNTDHYTRIVAAEAQEAYIRPWIEKLLNSRITEEQFLKRGLKFWDAPIKSKFMRILKEEREGGSEAAITYIRREASTISNFLYQRGAQPGLAQNATGRVVYQYGVYGINYKDLVFRTLAGADGPLQQMEAIAKHAIVLGALSMAGTEMGIDMGSWMSWGSVTGFGGGPFVGLMADIRDVQIAPASRKANAFNDLIRKNLLRTAVPGQLFFEDVAQSMDELDDPQKAALLFLLGKDNEVKRSWLLDSLEEGGFEQFIETPKPRDLPPLISR